MLTINLGVFMCGSSRENSHSEWPLPCTRCARWALPGIGPRQGHPRWDSRRTMRPADGARTAPRNEGSINHWRSLGFLRYHHLELSTDIISFLCSSFWVYHWILSVNSKVSSLGNKKTRHKAPASHLFPENHWIFSFTRGSQLIAGLCFAATCVFRIKMEFGNFQWTMGKNKWKKTYFFCAAKTTYFSCWPLRRRPDPLKTPRKNHPAVRARKHWGSDGPPVPKRWRWDGRTWKF